LFRCSLGAAMSSSPLAGGLVQRGVGSRPALMDAVRRGQFTPGPVLTTATFIGYVVAGVPALLAGNARHLLPSFVFVAASSPLIPRMRRSAWAGSFLDGVNVASAGPDGDRHLATRTRRPGGLGNAPPRRLWPPCWSSASRSTPLGSSWAAPAIGLGVQLVRDDGRHRRELLSPGKRDVTQACAEETAVQT